MTFSISNFAITAGLFFLAAPTLASEQCMIDGKSKECEKFCCELDMDQDWSMSNICCDKCERSIHTSTRISYECYGKVLVKILIGLGVGALVLVIAGVTICCCCGMLCFRGTTQTSQGGAASNLRNLLFGQSTFVTNMPSGFPKGKKGYPVQVYPGQAQYAQPYPGQPQASQPYPGHPGQAQYAQPSYPGQPQPSQPYPGQAQYAQPGQPKQPQPAFAQPYPGQPQPAQPHPGQAQYAQPYPGSAPPAQPYPGSAPPAQPYPGSAPPAQPHPGNPEAHMADYGMNPDIVRPPPYAP